MVLKLEAVENPLFPHARDFDQGFGERKVRIGEAAVVVAMDDTGDFESIQNAIDALPADGGVVYIKEGTYSVEDAVDLGSNDNIELRGAGRATIIKTGAANNLVSANGAKGLLINAIRFEDGTDAINFTSCTDSNIRDCWFINQLGSAVDLTTSSINVDGNFIDNPAAEGIAITGSADVHITNNIIENGSNEGIALNKGTGAPCSRVAIANNNIYNCSAGINLQDSSECTVTGNIVRSVAGAGIGLRGSSAYNTATGNKISGANIGVNVNDASGNSNTIIGNVLTGNTTAISDAGSNNQIAHNITI